MKEHHFDPTLHYRRSLHLPGYNYAAKGAYFVTICLDGFSILADTGGEFKNPPI